MTAFYFDTSALVKRYVAEPGSTWVRQICAPPQDDVFHLIIIGEITVVEISAAFAILERTRSASHQVIEGAFEKFNADFEIAYQIVEITSDLLSVAAELARKHVLKAYDALQLALALAARDALTQENLTLTLVAGDNQLLQAAQREGLTTENPFDHTDLDTSPSE